MGVLGSREVPNTNLTCEAGRRGDDCNSPKSSIGRSSQERATVRAPLPLRPHMKIPSRAQR